MAKYSSKEKEEKEKSGNKTGRTVAQKVKGTDHKTRATKKKLKRKNNKFQAAKVVKGTKRKEK